MPILSRYTVREISSHLAGVLAIIVGIFLVQRLASLLGDATEGALPVTSISKLLALRTVMALPSLLPVTIYLAILLGLGRLYQDREMEALSACGVPPWRVYRVVIGFAVVAALVNGFLSFSVRPWAAERFRAVRNTAMRDAEIADAHPGRFYLLGDSDEVVVFASGRSQEGSERLQDIFIQSRRGDRLSVFTAKTALEQRDDAGGARFVHLFDGYRYDLDVAGEAHNITEFGQFSIRLPLADEGLKPHQEEPSTLALLASSDPADVGELQWRVANAVSILLLALMAIPLSYANPRQGKYAKLFLAILLYLAYRSLLDAARHWIEDGALPFFPGLWAVHALFLLVGIGLLLFGPEAASLRRWGRGNRVAA